jgi:hypothetical protein
MNQFILRDEHSGKTRHFDSRSEAEEAKDDMADLMEGPLMIENVAGGTDNDTAAKVAEADPSDTEVVEAAQTASDKLQDRNLADDPLDYMPSHFVDTIQGTPVINRKGYAVIAAEYGVSVVAEPIELPHENGFEYACFRAIATTADGEEYSGIGTANVDRQDGDDRHLLAELAETRAMKRATAWATGVGVTAIEEMQGNL